MASSSNPPPTRLRAWLSAAREELGALARLLAWVPVWVLPVLLAAAVVYSSQRPIEFRVDVGTPRDEAFVRNFHTRLEEPGFTYRWSDVYGYIVLPGVGAPWSSQIELAIDAPQAEQITIIVNGSPTYEGGVVPGWSTITNTSTGENQAISASRDLVVELRAPDYRDESDPTESKGVKVDSLIYRQVDTGEAGDIRWPALASTAWLCASVIALYLLVARSLLGVATLRRAQHWGFVAALAGAGAIALLYDASRVDVAAASGQVFATLLTALALLVIGDRLLPRWVPAGRAGRLAARVGAIAFALAFILRFGGMGLPQAVIIDMPWHMKWLTTLLAGNWQALYYPGGLSSVPAEWGLELLIPKSPLFYVAAAPVAALPFDLETSVKWLICLLDSSVAALAFWFGARLRARCATAAMAAVMYALMPLAFRAFAYGILPTVFAQWLAAILFAVILAESDRRPRALAVIGTVALAVLAIVAFPTIAVFVTMVLGAYSIVLALRAEPQSRWRVFWPVGVAIVGGWVLAIAAYYGLYIEPVVASAQALLVEDSGSSSVRWPGGPPELVAWTADYVVTILPLLLAAAGLIALFAVPRGKRAWLALVLLAIWLAVLPLFLLVNYRMDMIGKHLFFTMLPVAVFSGAALAMLWVRRRWGAAFGGLLVAIVGWQGLVFWVERLVGQSS